MLMNVIFAYFSVCSFVHVQKCMGLSQGWGRKKVPCIFFYLG